MYQTKVEIIAHERVNFVSILVELITIYIVKYHLICVSMYHQINRIYGVLMKLCK